MSNPYVSAFSLSRILSLYAHVCMFPCPRSSIEQLRQQLQQTSDSLTLREQQLEDTQHQLQSSLRNPSIPLSSLFACMLALVTQHLYLEQQLTDTKSDLEQSQQVCFYHLHFTTKSHTCLLS